MKFKMLLLLMVIASISFSIAFGDETISKSDKENTNANKIGIGFGSNRVLIPIRTSNWFFLEPEFYYEQENLDDDAKGASSAPILKSSGETNAVGIGFMFLKHEKLVTLYYGIRLGLLQETIDSEFNLSGNSGKYKTDMQGYFLAPSFGIEYNFTDYLSLSGELRVNYESLTGTATQFYQGQEIKSDQKYTHTNTPTYLILRFYF